MTRKARPTPARDAANDSLSPEDFLRFYESQLETCAPKGRSILQRKIQQLKQAIARI